MGDYKENIIPHSHEITRKDRISKNGHLPKVLWFTGLSGSGKSTLASALETHFHNLGFNTYILDGDNIRSGLNSDLDFSDESRTENIRRISEVAKLFVDAGVIVLTAFISPFKSDRKTARDLIGDENFIEVHVDCPLEVCEQRDVKGLYKKARAGEIKHFTGIDSPFEEPENPDIKVDSANESLDDCLKKLIEITEPIIRL
ncbi:adenylyl-sulfate kinase [Ekhidna sp.]|uniref:adenylyl-sulfate kinase n=1 Tax=Ekhidna sp. TaxID=2608089 RepID=UPI0032EE7223